jgi:hypothetical protein
LKTPILGGSYVARSINAADNRMVNLFPEAIPEGSGGKEAASCCGVRPAFACNRWHGPIRGLWVTNGVAYVVSGSEFYSLKHQLHGHLDRHRIGYRPGQHGRQWHPDLHCL